MQLKEQPFASDEGLHTPQMTDTRTQKVTDKATKKTERLGGSHAQLSIPRACNNL